MTGVLKHLMFILFLALAAQLIRAQDGDTLLSIRADTNTMETGQNYTIRIEVDNILEFWSANIEIEYDPEQLYVIGTRSGSPVQVGDFLANNNIVIFNSVDAETGRITFTPSLIAPEIPVGGSGLLGTFQVVPLLAGETQLSFTSAQLSTITLGTDDAGNRVVTDTQFLSFLPVRLDLTISGDPATPPPEATATPTTTTTIDPFLVRGEETEAAEATLVNVTAAPASPTPVSLPVEQSSQTNPLLLLGISLIVFATAGLVVLYIIARSRSNN